MKQILEQEYAPAPVAYDVKGMQYVLTVNYGYVETRQKDESDVLHIHQTGESWTLPLGRFGKSVIVDTIVSEAYSHDQMEAIANNTINELVKFAIHVKNGTTPSFDANRLTEWDTLNTLREKAKAIARDAVFYVKAHYPQVDIEDE